MKVFDFRHLSILPLAAVMAAATSGAHAQNLFGKALIPDMVADASVQQIGDRFYCFATTDGYGQGLKTSGPPVVWVSDNFVDWSFDGIYFPSAGKQKYWAPSKVVKKNGKYYIYPTINGYMYPAVADAPDGPFRLAKGGKDEFVKPFVKGATLIDGREDPWGIDAEVFIDDDGKPYVFWGRYQAARLKDDMVTLDSIVTLPTINKEYSEGPVFFKRNGVYYYLYTLGGDEQYHYGYMMSHESPLGPWEYPEPRIIAKTDASTGVYGPGHGCVFNPTGTDDYYFVFLEFSRSGTNRQTYVNKIEFNDDGTIRPIRVDLNGVGAIGDRYVKTPLEPASIEVSSTREPKFIKPFKDKWCQRTEIFTPKFAFDQANGSRWMPADTDSIPWMKIDLGEAKNIERSDLYFIRPTSPHKYILETSLDGESWTRHDMDTEGIRSPHSNWFDSPVRYLKVTILEGEPGLWEWKVYEKDDSYAPKWGEWKGWGEQLDGSYLNPVIPADFSDIDCIKVGDTYYAISSTMQFSPGMTLLKSTDLVNWQIASNIVEDLSKISPSLDWKKMDRYGRGIWAGSLRYHDGRFYMCFGTPDEGIFLTSAKSPEGPWSKLTTLIPGPGWDDCTMAWDENGQPWFVATHFADGYKTYLWRMTKDCKKLIPQSRMLVNEGNGREASKLIRHDGYWYLVFSQHLNGVGRYVMAKRTRDLSKGFPEERQLAYACPESNEPNQGGIVEGEPGKWYFLTHHGTGDWGGREVSLLPVEWIDGWPVIGTPDSKNIGSMTWRERMPQLPESISDFITSDDFSGKAIKPHWQWNYQPRKGFWSLTERPGYLRLKAFSPIKGIDLMTAGNTLTQRSFRGPASFTVKADLSGMADGQYSGICHFAADYAALGVTSQNGKKSIVYLSKDKDPEQGPAIDGDTIWLRSVWDNDGHSRFSFSTDGVNFTDFGPEYQLRWGYYRGDRIGIFTFNPEGDKGRFDVDNVDYVL